MSSSRAAEADEPDAAEMAEAHAALQTPRGSEAESIGQRDDEERSETESEVFPSPSSSNDNQSNASASQLAAHAVSASVSSSAASSTTILKGRPDKGKEKGGRSLTTIEVQRKGPLLKSSRRHGEERPWKRRYFVLSSGTLMYYHASDYSDVPQLLLNLPMGTRVSPCVAPRGYGVHIVSPLQGLKLAAETPEEQAAWMAAICAAVGRPETPLPVSPEDEEAAAAAAAAVANSGMYKLKAALASAFATSRLGKLLIKRYLDEAGRLLIRTIIDFVAVESGAKQAARIETYVFDVASRIAIIMHASAVPAGVNFSQLQDDTVTFCQEFIRFSRDRRLQKLRALHANAAPSVLEPDLMLKTGAAMAVAWRSILEPTVPAKALRRFDAVVGHVFAEHQIRALLDNEAHRERMATIERSLRELLETY